MVQYKDVVFTYVSVGQWYHLCLLLEILGSNPAILLLIFNVFVTVFFENI